MKIATAVQVRINEQTDIREEIGKVEDIEAFNDALNGVSYTLEPGLLGWNGTHTLRVEDGTAYHVTIEGEGKE